MHLNCIGAKIAAYVANQFARGVVGLACCPSDKEAEGHWMVALRETSLKLIMLLNETPLTDFCSVEVQSTGGNPLW